jgi:chorismate synthase
MSGNVLGKRIQIMTFGESRGAALGVVIDGLPPGLEISAERIQTELDRRRPGRHPLVSQRDEADRVEIVSGAFRGKSTGAPICLLIRNDCRDASGYEELDGIYRPGHADFSYEQKYGCHDFRGGGRASGRETVARVAAGAVVRRLLEREGIRVIAYVRQIGRVKARSVDLNEIDNNPVCCPDRKAAGKMEKEILDARAAGDSVGGIVEVLGLNVPAGLGEPVFDKLDADLAKAVMSIGGVKAVEIGAGFEVAGMKGSRANDPFTMAGDKIVTKTNHAGGILGGISTGMPIVLRAAIKPTPSIAQEQTTLDDSGKKRRIRIKGRHDPCICLRVVPVMEAMVALTLADHLVCMKGFFRSGD